MPDLKALMAQVEAKHAQKPPKVFSRGTRPDTLTKLPTPLTVSASVMEPSVTLPSSSLSTQTIISLPVDKIKKDTVLDTEKHTAKSTDTDTVLDTDKDTIQYTVKNTDRDRERGIDTEKDTVKHTDTDTQRNTDTDTVNHTDTVRRNRAVLDELPEQQRKVLIYLISIRDFNNPSVTRPVGYDKIAKKLGCKRAFAQKCVNKLVERGFLAKRDSFNNMIKGTIYAFTGIDTDTVLDTDIDTQRNTDTVKTMGTVLDTDMDTRGSSGFLNNTTTDEKTELRIKLEQSAIDAKLDRFNINASELSQLWLVWKRSELGTFEQFLLSVEHLGFYLNDEALSQGIKNPRAYFMAKLREGFHERPAGFVSQQVRRERAKRDEMAKYLQELREEKQKTFDLEFEIWLEKLTPDDKKKHLKNMPMVSDLESAPARALLRDIFKQER